MYSYHYTYRITNTILNKHYYGSRSTNTHPVNDLGVKYLSSSKDKNFIKDQKENPQNYKYKIIFVFKTREKAIEFEIKLHNKFNVAINESFYNKAKQTSALFDTTGVSHNRNKGENNPMFGLIRSDHSKAMSGENNPFYGKKHSEETKKTISNNKKNFITAKDTASGQILYVSSDEFNSNKNLVGITSGYSLSDETKNKISASQKGRKKKPQEKLQCPHCEKIIAKNQANRFHFNNCKLYK